MKTSSIRLLAASTAILFATSSNAQSSNSVSAAVTIPTVVVSVTNAYGLAASSPATFALYNGSDAVAMDPSGNITVTRPTDIRFVFSNPGIYQFQPIGISFKQTDSTGSDQTGTLNFSIGSLGHGALVLHDNFQTASSFEYSIVFQRSDGLLGVIDPGIQNRGVMK